VITIAVDALGTGDSGGLRSSAMNMLQGLLRADRERRYLLLLDQPEPALADEGDRVRQIVSPIRHRVLSRFWAQAYWPILFRRERVALVHHLKTVGAFGLPGRKVYTIHDLTTLYYPDIYPWSDVLFWRHVQPPMLRRADAVVAVSQRTAQDLQEFFRLPAERLHVIYNGYAPRFVPTPPSRCADVCDRYGTGSCYLLHVGCLSRKKNLVTLVHAYEHLRARGYDGRLVFVGRRYEKGHDQAFWDAIEASTYRTDIVWTGEVPDADVPPLYSAADVTVFPSLHEGFGIVPIEAMACGCPVVTSTGGALQEVVGQAGIQVPADAAPERWAEAIWPLLEDAAVRAEWRERGLAWAPRYAAQEAARRTLALYDALLGQRGSPHGS
jgi:glycosyltransferase involved in cell wall biosynthesis